MIAGEGPLVECLVRRCTVEVLAHRVFCDGHRGILSEATRRALDDAYETRDLFRWKSARDHAISQLPPRLRPQPSGLGSAASS